MKRLVALSAIVTLPLLLAGCETVQAIRSFNVADYVHINLPWEHNTQAEPVRTADAAPPAKLPDAPDGLQHDDLRTPFGADNATAVASR
jgi:hypothetical protein